MGEDERLSAQRSESTGSSKTVVGSIAGDITEKQADSDRNPFPKRPWRKGALSWDAIRDHHYDGAGTESDPYVVKWLDNDPENPHNYSFGYKWAITILCGW